MSQWRDQFTSLLLLSLALLTCLLVMYSGWSLRCWEQDALVRRVTHLEHRLDSMYRARLAALDHQEDEVHMPNVYDFLPHLFQSPESLQPVLHLGNGVVGDPSRRASRPYLAIAVGLAVEEEVRTSVRTKAHLVTDTLEGLVTSMSVDEQDQTLIVVLLESASIDLDDTIREIKTRFRPELTSGLIEVISAPESFYPPAEDEEVDWRKTQEAKRILDHCFLIMYAQQRATFYLQLEVGAIAMKNFVTKMTSFASDLEARQNWMAIRFSQMEFMGTLFQSSELSRIVQFFLMFYRGQTINELFDKYVSTKVCDPEMTEVQCLSRKNEILVKFSFPLIQLITKPTVQEDVSSKADTDVSKETGSPYVIAV